jgi:hypothetical protein
MKIKELRELNLIKNNYLLSEFREVKSFDFYRYIFPVGTFEKKGHLEDKKPNTIGIKISKKQRPQSVIIFDELDEVKKYQNDPFFIMSPIEYLGRNKTAKNAQKLYGLTFDLDDVSLENLINLINFFDESIKSEKFARGYIPRPTFLVNSGTGFHLYYILDKPIRLNYTNSESFKTMKEILTKRIWNYKTSSNNVIQYQGITQGFRMVGSLSKLGKGYPVKAFKTGDKVSIDYLQKWTNHIPDPPKFTHTSKPRKQKSINNKTASKKLHLEKFYDWWLGHVSNTGYVNVGHRYNCIMTLAIVAKKANIPFEVLEKDAYSLFDMYEKKTEKPDNHFTKQDIKDGLKAYKKDESKKFTRKFIAVKSAIEIKPNKRNYRKQKDHLKRARAVQKVDYPNCEWRNNNGRPTKEKIYQEYINNNPNATYRQIQKDTGLSQNTIAKYKKVA